jgi:phosphopantothenoylcysteine decarboxylase
VLVEVVASKPSLEFYKKEEIEAIGARVWTDEDEWTVSKYHDEPRLIAKGSTQTY